MAFDCPYCGCHTCCNPNTGGACADCGRLVTRAVIDDQWLADMRAVEELAQARDRKALVGPPAPLDFKEGAPF